MRKISLVRTCGLLLALCAAMPALAQDDGRLPLNQFRAGPPVRMAARPVVRPEVGARPMLDQYADPLASYAAGDTIGNVTSSMVAAQAVEMRPAMAMPLGTVPVAALPTMSVYSIAPTMPTIVVPMITVP